PEPADADCSSLIYKSMIYAGIPCGYSKESSNMGTTRTMRADANSGKYFTKVSKADLQTGDFILCLNWGHVVVYMGNGKVFHASKPKKPHGYDDAKYFLDRANMIIRPNGRGKVGDAEVGGSSSASISGGEGGFTVQE